MLHAWKVGDRGLECDTNNLEIVMFNSFRHNNRDRLKKIIKKTIVVSDSVCGLKHA